MGRRRKQQQQVQQCGAGRKSCRVSAVLDVCLTCLRGEEWCFAIGEVGHVAPDQPPPWQLREEPEHPALMWEEDGPEQEPEDEGSVRPQPKRGEAERPQPKAPLAGEEYLLVSPPPPPSEGKEQELPLHPPRRTGPLSSEGIWDWLAEPEREIVDAFPAVISLLWARDGERWEAWEQKHHPASLPDIAAMVLNYLAADMGGPSCCFQRQRERSQCCRLQRQRERSHRCLLQHLREKSHRCLLQHHRERSHCCRLQCQRERSHRCFLQRQREKSHRCLLQRQRERSHCCPLQRQREMSHCCRLQRQRERSHCCRLQCQRERSHCCRLQR
ncbi:UNVERIFIED_CONTAM: hypothetical protein FKN15_073593 [Acipenser sinensis]